MRAGHRRERRCEIVVQHHRALALSGGHTRAAHDQWHADVGLVRRVLPLQEAVLAQVKAVVGGVDDVRPFELAGRAQRRHEAVDEIIHRLERTQAAAIGVLDARDHPGAQSRAVADDGRLVAHVGLVERRRARQHRVREERLVSRRRRGRPVRRERRHIDEERRLVGGAAPNQVGRLVRDDVHEKILRTVAVADGLSVLIEHVVVAAVGVAAHVPLRPPHGYARGGLISIQVFAEHRGAVAVGAQPGGDGRGLAAKRAEGLEPAEWRRVAAHTGAVRILSAQGRGARRAAERVRDEVVVEGRALLVQQRLRLRHEGVQLGVLVVGEDEDDIGAVDGRGGCLRGGGRSGGGRCGAFDASARCDREQAEEQREGYATWTCGVDGHGGSVRGLTGSSLQG